MASANLQGQDKSDRQIQASADENFSWKKIAAHVGPGFLVSIAYLDPGNLQSDLAAGAQYKYELLWVLLLGSVFALIIQSRAAILGAVTGKHLSEHCRTEYPSIVNYILWILAEVAIVASDIPEVIGTAFALNLLFKIPIWAGVLITGVDTLLFLGIQKYGVRNLEILIASLVFVIGCFFVELAHAKPKATEVLKGMFVPQLAGNGATALAISLFGALIMPHNLFLHSALVLSRKMPPSVSGVKASCRYFVWESGMALILAFLINLSVISVSGAVCASGNLGNAQKDECNDSLDLGGASFLLKNVLGSASSVVFAIALLASGQSSTLTGTYAGQYVMQGFLNLEMKPWKRNLITRTIAIVPSLVVALVAGTSGSGKLIIICSMILSFELPFALIPLLKFTSSEVKMGPHKTSKTIAVVTWIIGFVIVGINIYFLSTSFVNWLIHNKLPKVASVVIGLFVFPAMLAYVVGIIFLIFRRDRKITYVAPSGDVPL